MRISRTRKSNLSGLKKILKKLLTNDNYISIIHIVRLKQTKNMHEGLSGGVSPCQGEGRGFESRLVLFLCQKTGIKKTLQRQCEMIYCRQLNN